MGALISIALNPLVFRAVEPAQAWIRSRSRFARAFETTSDPLAVLPRAVASELVTGHVVIAGYGRVGRRIGEVLMEHGVSFVVVEQNRELVEKLRESGIHAVAGDADNVDALIQSHVPRADFLILATPDASRARRMIHIARMLNPKVYMVARTHSEEEAALLRSENIGAVFLGEHELARSMSRYVLEKIAPRGRGGTP